MARRFRVIQYDGPEDWIIGTISRSLQGVFKMSDATILTWEIAEGGKIIGRDPAETRSDERFIEIDGIAPELCAFDNRIDDRPLDASCGACNGRLDSRSRPPECARRSRAKPPAGNKSR